MVSLLLKGGKRVQRLRPELPPKNGSETPSFRPGRRRCPPGLESNPLVGHLSKQRHFLFSPPGMLYEPVGDIQRGSLPSHDWFVQSRSEQDIALKNNLALRADRVKYWRSLKPMDLLVHLLVTTKCQGTPCESGTVAPL